METYIFKSLKSDLVSVRCIDGWYHVVRLSKVVYVNRHENHCYIHVDGLAEPLKVRMPLTDILRSMLDDMLFVQINRSTVVNILYINSYADAYLKVLVNGKEVMHTVTIKNVFLHFYEIN